MLHLCDDLCWIKSAFICRSMLDKIIPKNNDEGRAIYGNLENMINTLYCENYTFLKITIEADCSIV